MDTLLEQATPLGAIRRRHDRWWTRPRFGGPAPARRDVGTLLDIVDRLADVLDQAVWGFDGEPRRCSRCNADEGDEHSETCPMPYLLAALATVESSPEREGGE